MMHNSPFTVAGLSSSTSSHHSPNLSNLNSWGSSSTSGPLASSFSDSLSQSRSHYQSGYLMSASQNNNAPQGNQRVDEVPVVQTKAKMNQILSRGSTTEFGMDSMFQSSRQRQTLADEDAPPMSSINDIPNEINVDPSPNRFQTRKAATESPLFSSRRNAPTPPSGPSQPVYILVFGYPPDKYSVTAEYFKSLGASTEPDQNLDLVSCFRIGYYDGGDAMRAVRKNGEVLGGSFMVGAKWADPVQAESLLGQPILRSTFTPPTLAQQASGDSSSGNNAMAVDEPFASPHATASTPTVGTPIKLAPSTSAFRKPGAPSKPSTSQRKGWGSGVFSSSASAPAMMGPGSQPLAAAPPPPPSKSVMGQMSDLIFGW